jgi:hypothetical protein
VALTPTAVERIAQAIHALRPQWPITSLETFLRDPKLANRPTRDVAIALTWIAVDPDTRTPARVHEDGPWWRAAVVDEAQTYRNPGTVCTIHPSQLEPCRHCTAQRVPANLERGTRNLPLALARAHLAQTRANTCAHGILKGHGTCRDCQPPPPTSPPAANPAQSAPLTSNPPRNPDTAPTDQPTPPAKTPTPPSPAQTATPAPTPNTAQTAPDSPPVESR